MQQSARTLRRQIDDFLSDFKELIGQNRYYVKDHQKNIQALSEIGITTRQRDDELLVLTYEDYSKGPLPDILKHGVYWEFGKQINNIDTYIKLKIVTDDYGNDMAICLSFHPAEYRMKFPFQVP